MVRETLTQIERGMAVVDRNQKPIGKVEMVFYSDEDPDNPGPETLSGEINDLSATPGWVNEFVTALSLEKPIPEPLQKRLHREGFIRVHETSYLGDKDYFVTLNQIANVVEDTVRLNIHKGQLMSFR